MSLVTDRELDRRVERALAAMRDLPAVQRDMVVDKILRADARAGGSRELLEAYRVAKRHEARAAVAARYRGLIRRDSLTSD